MASHARLWTPVIVWVAVIYTTIPFVRVLREWYVARWDPAWIGLSVALVLAVSAVAILWSLAERRQGLSRGDFLWIVGVTAVFLWWTLSLRRSPEEAVHFLEYGVLAILLLSTASWRSSSTGRCARP